MEEQKLLKVLHLPSNVSGNAYALSRAERMLGIESDLLKKYPTLYKFQFPSDIDLKLSNKKIFNRFYTITKAFLKYRKVYDIFHFNLGSTFLGFALTPTKLGFLDLPFYPKKAKLFVTFNGCEVRQKLLTIKRTPISACREVNCQKNYCSNVNVDNHKKKSIKVLSNYVKHMWALNPDLLYFLPPKIASFLPYTVFKYDQKISIPKLGKKIKIIHAPSNRVAKGTKYILIAIEKLLKKYADLVDFQMVENIPHSKALELYSQADLVIDQLLIGWYGSFAVEAMLMAKPVIVRIEEKDLHFIPKKMADDLSKSIINAHPYNIYHVLEKCIHDRKFLKQKSEASLEYARKWHNPIYVATLVKEKYES